MNLWIISLLFCYAAAIPLNLQTVLENFLDGGYRQELEPGKVGWYDPRERGGRLLDVCVLLSPLIGALTIHDVSIL